MNNDEENYYSTSEAEIPLIFTQPREEVNSMKETRTDRETLVALMQRVVKLKGFKTGTHHYPFSSKVQVYMAAGDEKITDTNDWYFSFEYNNLEVSHVMNGLKMSTDQDHFSSAVIVLPEWFRGIEKLIKAQEERENAPQTLEVNGHTYQLVK